MKVTEAASKPAIGVGAGVAGAAVADGEVVPAGEPDAVDADVGVPLCDGVGWVVVPPHAATSAASASRLGAVPHLGPGIRVMAETSSRAASGLSIRTARQAPAWQRRRVTQPYPITPDRDVR
jgi:hypothetical protein